MASEAERKKLRRVKKQEEITPYPSQHEFLQALADAIVLDVYLIPAKNKEGATNKKTLKEVKLRLLETFKHHRITLLTGLNHKDKTFNIQVQTSQKPHKWDKEELLNAWFGEFGNKGLTPELAIAMYAFEHEHYKDEKRTLVIKEGPAVVAVHSNVFFKPPGPG